MKNRGVYSGYSRDFSLDFRDEWPLENRSGVAPRLPAPHTTKKAVPYGTASIIHKLQRLKIKPYRLNRERT